MFGFNLIPNEKAAPAEALRAHRELDRDGLLTLRVRACLESDPAAGVQQVARVMALRERYGGGRMRPDAVKFFRAGAHVAGGSDWSVSSLNPLEGIEVAVTRRGPGAPPGKAWLPNERIALREALAAYTTEGACATFSEESSGTLEVGKAADLVVLSQDLFEVEPSEISETRVLLTVVDGQVVHGRLPASP